ncbi:MAG: TM2 domain-containing protein [Candidatus Cloacimonas sp.]|nr:TM2 domain-containing protein [Candidatus Cloacimonas sp.]
MVNALPQDKRTPFLMQLNTVKKNPTTAVLLALFLGGVGAHKFYLGQTGLGIVYLLFSWTTIPGWIALIEAFSLSGKTAQYNEKKAQEFYQMYTGTYPVRA